MMMIFRIAAAFAALTLFPVAAAELPPGLKIEKDGSFRIEQSRFQVIHLGSGHAASKLQEVKLSGAAEISGTLAGAGFKATFTPLTADSFRYRAEFDSAVPVDTLGLLLEFQTAATGRTVTVDGRSIVLPNRYDGKTVDVLGKRKSGIFTCPLDSGTLLTADGKTEVKVQDNRKSGRETFTGRFYFQPSAGKLTRSSLDLVISLKTLQSAPIDLSAAANMGLTDPVAGDGKGGWTDQGPDNDLRSFKPGRFPVGGSFFQVSSAEQSVIVLGRNFPREATVGVSSRGSYLYLLHAGGWVVPGRTGEITVAFADGSTQTVPVESHRDVGNWHRPTNFDNAAVIWTGENRTAGVGLYFSQFQLRRDDPRKLTFRAFDQQLWLIAGVTLAESAMPRQGIVKSTVIAEGADWVKLDSPRTVIPGSPLDFSGMLDAPAGKYGKVTVAPDGHFSFEKAPGKRIKFVGVNLCFSAQFLDRQEADALAERLARHGYNALRIHHQDNTLVKKEAADSLTIDTEQLDRLEYLFAACKKRGIYITTDVFVNRKLKEGDNIPEFVPGNNSFQMKALLPISRAAAENWKEFARRWLGHRNPHTGLTWAEDPALYIVSFTNENNLYSWYNQVPKIAARYQKLYPEWMQKNHPDEAPGNATIANRRFLEFLYTLQHRSILEQAAFLKDELKLSALRTDLNMHNKIPLALTREKLDTVDDHKYHDHPKFPVNSWKLPNAYRQISAIGSLGYEVPELLFAPRLFGKPFSITEYKFCVPNIYRSEGGPLIGGYAALQDWDALFQFAWSHSDRAVAGDRPLGTFDYANEPLAQLSDRQTMLFFRRGDVAPAQAAYAWDVPEDFWNTDMPVEYPVEFSRLGFIARVGSMTGNRPIPGVVRLDADQASGKAPLPDAKIEAVRREFMKEGKATSSTGELHLDSGNKTLAVDSPRSVCVTLAKGTHSAGRLSVSGVETPSTVSVSSLDSAPVAAGKQLLLFHLTNVLDDKTAFEGDGMKLLTRWGTLPHLVRRDPAKISLRLDGDALPKVEALRLDGSSYGEVRSEFRNGTLEFTADPGLYPGGVMVYWITR